MNFREAVGFAGSSVGKESACNAGGPGSIPRLGRSSGEGISYPFEYSWASLVAQLVKSPPAMRETWVQSLGSEDPLEKGKVYSLQHSGLENSMECIVHGRRVSHDSATFISLTGSQFLGSSTFSSVQFSHSVVSDSLRAHESHTSGLPVHHQLPEFTQTSLQSSLSPSSQ